VPDAKVKGKIGKGEGEKMEVKVTVDITPDKGDVGDLAKAAAEADTPHKSKGAPTTRLILKAPSLTKENAKGVADALKGVKGVNAKQSRADVDEQMIYVRLNDKGGAKLSDIQKALADYTKK
jgi:hypothetical protein